MANLRSLRVYVSVFFFSLSNSLFSEVGRGGSGEKKLLKEWKIERNIFKLRRHDFTSHSLCNVNGGPSMKLLRAANRRAYVQIDTQTILYNAFLNKKIS